MRNWKSISKEIYSKDDYDLLKNCTLCPRECGVNRYNESLGICSSDAGFNIASICIHRGEEPSISGSDGICNIFFAGCNLRCIYCQNYEISRHGSASMNLNEILDQIENILTTGPRAIGFVSPSHVVPQVKAIIRGLRARGLNPVTVYNTNSYDKPELIRSLADMIDVYLPDYKYVTPEIALKYSDASDYPEVALKALKEMYYQKGSGFITDSTGMAINGLLIRHLVLPGNKEESKKVLQTISEELSTGINISLMSQYYPTPVVNSHIDLHHTLYKEEYESVVKEMENLGFRNGWLQDMKSYNNYRPDFSKVHPFE
jgi:putative pyruvate formate lyase activating enzyme